MAISQEVGNLSVRAILEGEFSFLGYEVKVSVHGRKHTHPPMLELR